MRMKGPIDLFEALRQCLFVYSECAYALAGPAVFLFCFCFVWDLRKMHIIYYCKVNIETVWALCICNIKNCIPIASLYNLNLEINRIFNFENSFFSLLIQNAFKIICIENHLYIHITAQECNTYCFFLCSYAGFPKCNLNMEINRCWKITLYFYPLFIQNPINLYRLCTILENTKF